MPDRQSYPYHFLYQLPEWKRRSKEFIVRNPECMCGCGRRSEVVDHIIPHNGDYELFWDEGNWQALSKPCHSRKTMREMNTRRDRGWKS